MGDTIVVFTDGACHGNPGPGGWGAVLRFRDRQKCIYGGEAQTTNNRMELLAAIMALEALTTRYPVQVWTDSQYLRNGITSWIHSWRRNNWMTATRQPVKNADLWKRLDVAASGLVIDWRWVKGHAGHEGNELADQLATRGAVEAGGSPRSTGQQLGGPRRTARRSAAQHCRQG